MDRKSKPDHRTGEKTSIGASRSKEEALGKIHQMEWIRNKKEPWHLARSNSRVEDVQEKKRHNKNEESYFEGTGSQKIKKSRKPRQAITPTPPCVPPGFSIVSGPSGPPPVNAWSQKKGSALFSKPPEEVDEEDEMLKLVIQESLKTAEDEKRNRERLMMFSVEAQSSTKTERFTDDTEDYSPSEEDYFSDPPVIVKQPQATDLHLTEDTSQSRRPAPPHTRKSSSPRDVFPPPPVVDKNGQYPYNHPRGKTPPTKVVKDNNYNIFEPSRPQAGNELYIGNYKNPSNQKIYPQTSEKNIRYDPSKSVVSHNNPTPKLTPNREILIPEKDYSTSTVDDVCASLESTLTFGDTKGLLEREDPFSFSRLPQFQPKLSERQTSVETQPLKTDTASYSDSTETDLMLYNFIRHEPPSSQISNAVQNQKTDTLTEMLSDNGSKQYLPVDLAQYEQHNLLLNNLPSGNSQSVLVNTNGQDSSSSLSDSPLQNVSPYGSFDKQVAFGAAEHTQIPTQNTQHPYLYALTAQNHQEDRNSLQAMQYAARALTPQVAYPNIPPGYIPSSHGIRGILPLNPQLNQYPGLPQYHLPNSNLMMPSIQQGLHYNSHQAQLQHLLAVNAPNQYQQHPFNVSESPDNPQKEQTSAVSQSQVIQKPQMIPTQSQSQVFPTQNQPHMLLPQKHSQMLMMPNQPQIVAAQKQDMAVPEEDSYLKEYQQINSQHHQFDQGIPQRGKTKEEIMLQFQQTLQTLNQLQQELSGSDLPTPPIQIPQPQAYPYPSHPGMMGISNFYQGMPVSPQLLHQLNQQVPKAEETSPTNLPSQGQVIVSRPSSDPSEMNGAAMEPQVGRGRGRLL